MRRLVVAALAAASLVLVTAATALADPGAKSDNLSSPLQDEQQALIQKGLELKASGKVAPGQQVAKVGKGSKHARYVQLERTGHSNIFVILAQFGNQKLYGGTDGPLMGEIPAPDRNVDNSTIWFDEGYTPMHYQQLYFDHTPGANSVTNYYQQQSSGRFAFDGAVTDWVTVKYNEARYGTDLCGQTVCTTVWSLLRDAANQWVLDQEAAGKSLADVKAYLAGFDQEDRYDYNGNGNFDEPDGYIDHFQLIHAGEGEETGGGAQGSDAIWSHRWYSFQSGIGNQGPSSSGFLGGGFEIGAAVGQPTGYWVGDYIMENENAGVGVIAHETGHDYGLPDEYDTTYAGAAPSAWWTTMSNGSYGGDGTNGAGNRPVDFNAYDKLVLGFLKYKVVDPFTQGKTDVLLGPAEYNTDNYQAAIVPLPLKKVVTSVGTPTQGTYAGFSGSGSYWDSTAVLTPSVAVPAGSSTLTFDTWYDTEQDWDFAFLQVSTDNGAHWTNVRTSESDPAANDQSGFNSDSTGISGTSGAGQLPNWYGVRPSPVWVPVTADLSAYAGQSVRFRFEYVSDSGTNGIGFEFDNLRFGSTAVDGVEDASKWAFAGGAFQTDGTLAENYYTNYYIAENRQFVSYDTGLVSSPFITMTSTWVQHYPYEDGVLVSYWDNAFEDNDVGVHPGEGLILPVDVHQQPIMRDDGTFASTTVQVSDAPLNTHATRAATIPNPATGGSYQRPSLPGVKTFDDRNSYWNPAKPDWGVKTRNAGVVIDLRGNAQGVAKITISAAK